MIIYYNEVYKFININVVRVTERDVTVILIYVFTLNDSFY